MTSPSRDHWVRENEGETVWLGLSWIKDKQAHGCRYWRIEKLHSHARYGYVVDLYREDGEECIKLRVPIDAIVHASYEKPPSSADVWHEWDNGLTNKPEILDVIAAAELCSQGTPEK